LKTTIFNHEEDAQAWDEFVGGHPAGLIFHLANWERIIKRAYNIRPHYLIAKQGADVVGVLPSCLVKRPFIGTAIISNPFCVSAGPLAQSGEASLALIQRLVEDAKKLNVRYIELRDVELDIKQKNSLPWEEQKIFATFKKTLSSDKDQLLLDIPNRQRAVIRKAQKNGLEVLHHRELKRFLKVYGRSLRDLGTPIYPERYFSGLLEFFSENIGLTTVAKNGQDLTSVLSFYYKDTVLPYYGGGIPEARQYNSYPYMYWQLMNHAIDGGYSEFDFGRSPMNSGPYSFKKNLGFPPRTLIYSFLPIEDKSIPNLTHGDSKVQSLTKIWSKLPVPLTNRLGPIGAIYAI
jgi:FemAB-related protein (PEP-CTERM system-associated)